MKTIPLIIILLVTLSSCKKKEVEKQEIKYEIISTANTQMQIDYTNEFGNNNTEYFTGTSWTKTIDASKPDNFFLTTGQDLSNLPLGNYTMTARIYFNGVIVDEQVNDNGGNGSSVGCQVMYSK